MARRAIDIDKLDVDERLDLLEAIWESLTLDSSQVPVPESHKVELDRRLAEIDAGDDSAIPWEEVLERIRNRMK